MKVEARLSRLADDPFFPWRPESSLRALSQEELELSTGFLRTQFEKLLRGLDLHWLTLLAGAGIFARVERLLPMTDFPDDLEQVWPVLFSSTSNEKGEVGLIGARSDLLDEICDGFAPKSSPMASELLVEYLVRRLISSIAKCWAGPERIQMFLLPTSSVQNVEVLGVVQVRLALANSTHDIYLGFGPETTRFIEDVWASFMRQDRVSASRSSSSSATSLIAVELCEIKVPPSRTLLDYLCAGAIIDLGAPFYNEISLRVNGRKVGSGSLFFSDERFAVQISEVAGATSLDEQGETNLRVEIGSLSLPTSELETTLARGAVVICNEEVSNRVSLVIGREVAAIGELGILRGNLAVVVGG